MVHMTCCGTRYTTVRESMNHICPEAVTTEVTMPEVTVECKLTTVEMQRHGRHESIQTDKFGNPIKVKCRGF